MKAARRLCLLLFLFGFTSMAFAQQYTTMQVLAKLDEKAKMFSSLEASITNTQTVYGSKDPAQSGKIYIKMANSTPRLLWDVAAPKEGRMRALIDKGQGTVYFPNSNTYRRQEIDPKTDILQLLLTGFGVPSATLTKNYNPNVKGTEAIGSVKAVVLELTSISELTAKFPKITLWLDPQSWTPVQTRLTQNSGDYNDFVYSNVRLNRGVSDSAFDLKMPSNAEKQ